MSSQDTTVSHILKFGGYSGECMVMPRGICTRDIKVKEVMPFSIQIFLSFSITTGKLTSVLPLQRQKCFPLKPCLPFPHFVVHLTKTLKYTTENRGEHKEFKRIASAVSLLTGKQDSFSLSNLLDLP